MIEHTRRRGAVGLALLLVALLALAGCKGANMTTLDVTLDKSDDAATVTVDDGRAVIDVTSASGIGGLTATLSDGKWPAEVVVRLNTRGLERLDFGYGNVQMSTGLSSTGDPNPPLMLTVVDEDGNVQRASPSADIYYPVIRVVDSSGAMVTPAFPLPAGSAFEIVLPPHFHQDEEYPFFWMEWVDFYR